MRGTQLAVKKKTAASGTSKLAGDIARLRACTGERDMYPIIRDMLMDRGNGIRLTSNHIVVDTNLPGKAAAPDLALYTGPKDKPVRTPDYLFAIVEAKPKDHGLADPGKILEEKRKYVQAATRWFFVIDQKGVARIDLDDEAAGCAVEEWTDLENQDRFREMFGCVSNAEIKLERQLELFEAGKLRVAHRDVAKLGRRAFIDTIRQVSRLLDEAVSGVIKRRIRPSAQMARALVADMEAAWGAPVYRWDSRRGGPIEFTEATKLGMSAEDSVRYASEHAAFTVGMRPHLAAWRIEVQTLPTYAEKLGRERVSFASSAKSDRKAVASFAYETGSLILSRMLMVRFSEDNGFLTRQISNGGVAAFSGYAGYFKESYQALLSQAYKSARALYQDLFDPHSLDWVLDFDDPDLSLAIKHSLYLLSRWDFRTVKGDILSGVYDHYLETEKRRDLGEVFTRPEIARYVLDACGWDKSKSMIDPACGTGTFLVEALRAEVDRLREAGALDVSTAKQLLGNIHGLDINPFSVSLSQIQILWHMMDLFKDRPAEQVRTAAAELLPHIMVDGGLSSLDTMGVPMVEQAQGGLALGTGKSHVEGRRIHDFPARYRQINGRSYHVVVGNPPYVRAARRIKEHLSEDYRTIKTKQFDLYVPFVFRTLKWWLKPEGRMGLVLPLAILDAGYAAALRAVIGEYRIVEIVDLELLRKKTFHGVKRPTIILIIENSPASDDDELIITTVPPQAHDPIADVVHMDKAVSVTIARRLLRQTSYLPQAFLDDAELVKLSGTVTGAGAELTTKVKEADVPVLQRIGEARRLIEDVDVVWTSKGGDESTTTPTAQQRATWRPQALLLYGLKLGGDAALQSADGPEVYRGLNIFPGRLLGRPAGRWNAGGESETNIYKYRDLLDHSRLYASREIAQVPTMVRAPEGVVFQNTTMLIQLREPFPLNVWVLSRIVQFYCAKLLRGSVIEDITAHWYKRQLALLPMPAGPSPELVERLHGLGERLFAADREIADEFAALDAIVARGSSTVRDLIADASPLAAGLSLSAVPEEEVTVDVVAADDDGIEIGDVRHVRVGDADLRRWLRHVLERKLQDGPFEVNRKTLLDVAVPDDLATAVAEVVRLEASEPGAAYEAALDELDALVGEEFGLSADQLAYVKTEMASDDLLKAIAPSLERRGLSRQSYRGDVEDDDEGE